MIIAGMFAYLIGAHSTWVWWLRKIEHDQELRVKVGLIIIATGVAAVWPLWWAMYHYALRPRRAR